MGFQGVVAVVAQGGLLPDEPFMGTDASPTYANALTSVAYESGEQQIIHYHDGSDYVSNGAGGFTLSTMIIIDELYNWTSSGQMLFTFYGYMHGDASYAWNMAGLNDQIGDATATIEGTASTSQDATSSTGWAGIGKYLKITAGGGRGGLDWGNSGEYVTFLITATANSVSCPSFEITMTLGNA
jgi:hypothetical protein